MYKPKPLPFFKCTVCGVRKRKGHPKQKFCSHSCRQRDYRLMIAAKLERLARIEKGAA